MPIMSEIAMRVILRLNIPQGGLWLVGPAAVKSEIGEPSSHQNVSMISKLALLVWLNPQIFLNCSDFTLCYEAYVQKKRINCKRCLQKSFLVRDKEKMKCQPNHKNIGGLGSLLKSFQI